MSTLAIDIGSLIAATAGVNGGKPRAARVGVSVHQLATILEEGIPPDEIADRYELTMAEVYAALAYYFANKQQVDDEITDQAESIHQLRSAYPNEIGPNDDLGPLNQLLTTPLRRTTD